MAKKNNKNSENSLNLAKGIIKKLKKDPVLLKKFVELFQKERFLEKARKEFLLPDYIFNKKITLFETSVKYLKENLRLNFKKIADLVGRDQRNIWQVYNSAKIKFPSRFPTKKSRFMIPVSVLSDKKFSVLEAIVAYLRDDLGLTYHEIAVLIKRDDRTVWTVYQRFKKKSTRRRYVK